jgi:hypothetical protein
VAIILTLYLADSFLKPQPLSADLENCPVSIRIIGFVTLDLKIKVVAEYI